MGDRVADQDRDQGVDELPVQPIVGVGGLPAATVLLAGSGGGGVGGGDHPDAAQQPGVPSRVLAVTSAFRTRSFHQRVRLSPSKAVEPSSTQTTATSPASGRRADSPARGLRSPRRPSARRPMGARWPTRVE